MSDPRVQNEEIKQLYLDHVNPSFMRLVAFMGYDAIEDHAAGAHVWDNLGNDYLDCLGGFGVFSLGHTHPKVVEAVIAQLKKMPMASRVLLNEPLARLAKKLAEISPGDLQYLFACNSGTEAVEGALKIARLKTGKHGIIYTERAFHGKTMGSLSVTGKETYQKPFRPLIPGAKMVTFGDADALLAAIDNDTACFIVEPMQGEGGIHVPSDDYFPKVQKICRDKGVLLIIDEVQTGLGRTGKMFACDYWDIKPDIMTLAKALGGGIMPIGAILGTADVWTVFENEPLIHSSTFGGNPLACSAALAALDATIEEDLPNKAAAAGEIMLKELNAMKRDFSGSIKDVRGRGCFIGVEFSDSDFGGLMISAMAARKILVAFALNNQKVLRVEPPLAIDRKDIDRLLVAFRDSVLEVEGVMASLQ
jgi:putrescine aminotransferase